MKGFVLLCILSAFAGLIIADTNPIFNYFSNDAVLQGLVNDCAEPFFGLIGAAVATLSETNKDALSPFISNLGSSVKGSICIFTDDMVSVKLQTGNSPVTCNGNAPLLSATLSSSAFCPDDTETPLSNNNGSVTCAPVSNGNTATTSSKGTTGEPSQSTAAASSSSTSATSNGATTSTSSPQSTSSTSASTTASSNSASTVSTSGASTVSTGGASTSSSATVTTGNTPTTAQSTTGNSTVSPSGNVTTGTNATSTNGNTTAPNNNNSQANSGLKLIGNFVSFTVGAAVLLILCGY